MKSGVVTLAGEVISYFEKWNAERAAQRVSGVKALAVELKVKLSEFGSRTDADVAESAKNILGWTSSLPEDAIKVLVEGGWLTLSGNVEWQYHWQDAADSVRYFSGVAGVSNQIAIKPSLSATVVKSDIGAALKLRAAPSLAPPRAQGYCRPPRRRTQQSTARRRHVRGGSDGAIDVTRIYGVSSLRIALSSLRRAGPAFGYASFMPSKVSSTICETINRELFLSSAGTMYQGESLVLVALRHCP